MTKKEYYQYELSQADDRITYLLEQITQLFSGVKNRLVKMDPDWVGQILANLPATR